MHCSDLPVKFCSTGPHNYSTFWRYMLTISNLLWSKLKMQAKRNTIMNGFYWTCLYIPLTFLLPLLLKINVGRCMQAAFSALKKTSSHPIPSQSFSSRSTKIKPQFKYSRASPKIKLYFKLPRPKISSRTSYYPYLAPHRGAVTSTRFGDVSNSWRFEWWQERRTGGEAAYRF